MRTKVTLLLLFLNVALFAYIYYQRVEGKHPEQNLVLGPETANIQILEIASGDPARASAILSLFTQPGRFRTHSSASPQSPTSRTSGPGMCTTMARFFPNAMAMACPSSAYVGSCSAATK